MAPADQDAWKRLGRLLAKRRIQIGARYKNKNLFATERELNRRMLWQIETGARDTYRDDTLRAVESAYMLVPGSLDRTLAGGELEPLRTVPETALTHADSDRPSPAADQGYADTERVIRLLIEGLDPSRPKLQVALRAIMALEDGNGHLQPLPQRAELLLILLDRHLGSGAVPAAERRNGSIALVPTA